jgi:hypothetical protein
MCCIITFMIAVCSSLYIEFCGCIFLFIVCSSILLRIRLILLSWTHLCKSSFLAQDVLGYADFGFFSRSFNSPLLIKEYKIRLTKNLKNIFFFKFRMNYTYNLQVNCCIQNLCVNVHTKISRVYSPCFSIERCSVFISFLYNKIIKNTHEFKQINKNQEVLSTSK